MCTEYRLARLAALGFIDRRGRAKCLILYWAILWLLIQTLPSPSSLCCPTSVSLLGLVPHPHPPAGIACAWRLHEDELAAVSWVKNCLCFPFLLAHPQFLVWNLPRRSAEWTLGKVCWVLAASPRRSALHPWWDVLGFFEVGFRASPSVYDSLSIMLQHLLWKKNCSGLA